MPNGTTNLVKTLLGEGKIDTTQCQELRTGIVHCSPLLLVPNDLLFVILYLRNRGDHGYKVNELLTEFVDAGIINLEEKEGFGLFGKTGPVKNQSVYLKRRLRRRRHTIHRLAHC